MPSKSEPQRKLMAAVAGDPDYGKKGGISLSVAREYTAADRAMQKAMAAKLRKKGK